MDEIGTLTIERNQDGAFHFVRADPRIRIGRELAHDLRDGDHFDDADFTLDGDVLTIRDDYGQRFIYRIRWDDYADGGYLAEWPD